MQRKVAIGVVLVVVLGTSGCVQAVTGGPIVFEASEAWVDDGTLQETGYELQEQDEFTIEETVDVPVVGEREIKITNHLASYGPAAAQGDASGEAEQAAGAFMVVSTPQAQVAGQGTNPLGRVPLKELLEQIGDRADDGSDVRHVGSQEITILGSESKVEKYSSTTQADGQEVETFVYVTRVGHGEDYVVGIGMVPQEFEDHEDAIFELMRGIDHEEN